MCNFCEHDKFVKLEGYVNTSGALPGFAMLNALLGGSSSPEDEKIDGIYIDRYEGSFELVYDNSSGEYNSQFVEIYYCPFCGEKLSGRVERR